MKNDMKPFNIEHAKAGAPYGYLDGTTAEILKFDILGPYPILSIWNSQFTFKHLPDGSVEKGSSKSTNNLVMIPLGYCERKPVFVGDKLFYPHTKENYIVNPNSITNFSHFRWFVEQKEEIEYPKSKMSDTELYDLYNTDRITKKLICDSLRLIANAAIERAIIDKQVIISSKYFTSDCTPVKIVISKYDF
jgi:hypothetical protein